MFKKIRKVFSFFLLALLLTGLISCTQKKDNVDLAIDEFIENYADIFLKKNDYLVIKGLDAFNKLDKTKLEFTPNLGNTSECLKAAVIKKALNESTTEVKEALLNLEVVSIYDYANYVIAANILNVSKNELTIYIEYLKDINNIIDPDTAAFALIALFDEDFNKDELIEIIVDSITPHGVSSWDTVNASSTAMSILGLMAVGYDSEVIEGLVNNLLDFKVDGAYLWSKDFEEVDLSFSTPQAFLALAFYKQYKGIPLNIFK